MTYLEREIQKLEVWKATVKEKIELAEHYLPQAKTFALERGSMGNIKYYKDQLQKIELGLGKVGRDMLHYTDKKLRSQIISRMIAEEAKDLSDNEIKRTLTGCIAGEALIPITKQMVREGLLTKYHLQIRR